MCLTSHSCEEWFDMTRWVRLLCCWMFSLPSPHFIRASLSAFLNLTCPPAAFQSPVIPPLLSAAVFRPCSQPSPWVPLQQMESYQVSGYQRACISMFVCNRAVRWALCVFATHSWRLVLHDLSLSGARVWRCCRNLLLLGHHFCGCYVHSRLYWNSAGKSIEFLNDRFILLFMFFLYACNIITGKAHLEIIKAEFQLC